VDCNRIDDLARALMRAPSRRHVLRSLAGAGLGLGVTWTSQVGEAKKRRKRKKRDKPRTPQATPNEYGCLNVDDPCTSATECCSGICEGTKGNRTCRAHDSGDCEAGIEPEACGEENESICTTSSGDEGYCGTTTGNAGYCAGAGACYPCKTDVDCQRANNGFFGPTAACLKCAFCPETGGTACFMAEFP
jgi:hypothetical protein